MNASIRAVLVTLVSLLVPGDGDASETYWNGFRGPHGQGRLEGANPPTVLDESTLRWKVALAPGHSSPVIWRNRIFLSAVEDNRLVTICVDRKTGAILWKQSAPEVALGKVHAVNSHASPTPTVDQEHVYSYFGAFGVICYSHDGSEVWRRPLPPKDTGYGTASSPVLYDELLILVLDDSEKTSRILAMSKKDGTPSWEAHRPLVGSGWSTPVIWRSGERDELVVFGRENLTSYNVRNGDEIWWITGLSRQVVAVPIIGDDRLFVSASDRGGRGGDDLDPVAMWKGLAHFDANKDGKLVKDEMTEGFGYPLRVELPVDHPGWGFPITDETGKNRFIEKYDTDKDSAVSEQEFKGAVGGGGGDRGRQALMSIRPGAKGDAKETHVDWAVHRNLAEIPTPVLCGNKIFSVRDGGLLTCFSADNGEVLFNERIQAPGQYSASVIAADDRVYVASVNGVITILKAEDQLQIISRSDLEEAIYATPAIQNDSIYIRTSEHLYAFGE
jgi:outer membrane protein assembly factor BamB